MHRNVIETVLGAVVLVVAVIFIVFAYTHSGVRAVGGYDVIAKFGRVDGLAVGDDVRLGGMKVGAVKVLSLDLDGYTASVTIRLDSVVRLPTDSAVAIHTEGLFGGKYAEIQPGGEESYIEPGGFLAYSQDAIILEEVIEKIVAIAREVGKKCKQCTGG
jgi:phospholipid/cholesterol/gamma-HCH transport system substrate-binding protein